MEANALLVSFNGQLFWMSLGIQSNDNDWDKTITVS